MKCAYAMFMIIWHLNNNRADLLVVYICRIIRQASWRESALPATNVRCHGPTFHANTCCGAMIVNYRPYWRLALLSTDVWCVMWKYRKYSYHVNFFSVQVMVSPMLRSSHLSILIIYKGMVMLNSNSWKHMHASTYVQLILSSPLKILFTITLCYL